LQLSLYNLAFALAGASLPVLAGCSSADPTGFSPFTDAAAGGMDAPVVITAPDGGASLKPFAYPADPGAGAIYVTISGESNALTGYPFPPANFASDTYMPDGWEFRILECIVVVDRIVLWSDPDLSTTDPSRHGPRIAHLSGPFVVDLHRGGKIVGQAGYPELATPLGSITSQNDNGGQPFDTGGGTRYGFGFSTVPATYDAYNVNLDESEAADFALMVEKGYSVFYRGTTVWKGDDPGNTQGPCVQTNAGPSSDAGYDFSPMDRLNFAFALGFSTPTDYINCQNQTGGGTPLPGEDFARGVAASPSQSTVAQVTLHMDHPFWESFQENSPVHWDNIAAQYLGSPPDAAVEVHTEDLVGTRFHPWFDSTGTPLPWRNCVGPYYTPPGNGQMFFGTLSVKIDPGAACTKDSCPSIRDYYDYMRFTQSTQGHLNSQGLCYVARQYPAPAGGS
jgi:hypothetical protein